MYTCFEDLCTELIHLIFEYINPQELYEQFTNLNLRLNNILASLSQLKFEINYINNENILNILASHIGFLRVNTWNEIDLNKFCNLRALSIVRPSPKQLKQIRAEIMPKLFSLSLFTNVQFIPPNQLISDVFSNRLPFLNWIRLGHIDSSQSSTWSQSYSLRYLHISCSDTNIMRLILFTCPNLRCLHIDVLRQSEKCLHTSSIIVNHPLRKLILQDFCRSIPQEDLQEFFLLIPNIEKLQLNISCQQSLIKFLRHLVKSLVYLNEFHCDITEYSQDFDGTLNTIYDIHPIFCRIQYRVNGSDFRILSTK